MLIQWYRLAGSSWEAIHLEAKQKRKKRKIANNVRALSFESVSKISRHHVSSQARVKTPPNTQLSPHPVPWKAGWDDRRITYPDRAGTARPGTTMYTHTLFFGHPRGKL